MRLFQTIFFLLFAFKLSYSQQDSLKVSKRFILNKVIEQTIDSSNAYYNNGLYAKSLMSNIKLLKLAKQSNDPNYIGTAHRYLGYDFLVVNDTSLARQHFENARQFAEVFNDDLTLGLSFMDLANYHARSDFDFDKAIVYHDISIERFKKSKDSTELVKAYYNGVVTAFFAGDNEKARMYLTALNNPKLAPFKLDHFFSAENSFWATYHNENKEYLKAELKAKDAIKLLEKSGAAIEKQDAYEQLAISYYGQQKYKEAYDSRLLSEEFYDESLELRQDEQSQAALAKLKVEQYKTQIEDQKDKTALQVEISENKSALNNMLILVCFVGLLLFIALLCAYLKRRGLNIALEKKNEEYLKAKEKSELLTKAKSKFFSTVSHELRTPLYGVIGLSTILLEDPNLKTHEEDIKSLKFSADYLLALINDVLQINKIDSNNLDNDERQFNVRHFIENIASTFEYMRVQNKNVITINIDPEIPGYLKGNVVRLSQILMNLVGNALKFTENGVITIALSLKENNNKDQYTISFLITDTGIGIPKEKQATIFDEFTQVDSLNYTYQGTGLGLPIVKKLLLASNSEIHLESELGEGTKLKFDFFFQPVIEPIKEESSKLRHQSLLKDKNILIADDNRINQIVTKKILEKKGVNCTIVENGLKALELLEQNNYDLVLMDINMPIMDGFEATTRIREFNSSIPIIALTAVEIEEVRNKIYVVGMNDIIVKPYDDRKFTQTILENLN